MPVADLRIRPMYHGEAVRVYAHLSARQWMVDEARRRLAKLRRSGMTPDRKASRRAHLKMMIARTQSNYPKLPVVMVQEARHVLGSQWK